MQDLDQAEQLDEQGVVGVSFRCWRWRVEDVIEAAFSLLEFELDTRRHRAFEVL